MQVNGKGDEVVVDWMILFVCVPGYGNEHAGILLLDQASNRLFVKLKPACNDWPQDIGMVWDLIPEELERLSIEMGGGEAMTWLETTFSNSIRVSDRNTLDTDNVYECLNNLFAEQVQAKSRVADSSI